jgi:hypothetical protein
MINNTIENKSKINTHSLKAQNFYFLVKDYESNNNNDFDIVQVPMNELIQERNNHIGTHYLVYILDSEEVQNKVFVTKEELESVVTQIRIELGGVPLELIGVVNE